MMEIEEPDQEFTPELRDAGWAPGGYLCKCHDCGKFHVADKRAAVCVACAKAHIAGLIRIAEERALEIERLKRELAEAHAEVEALKHDIERHLEIAAKESEAADAAHDAALEEAAQWHEARAENLRSRARTLHDKGMSAIQARARAVAHEKDAIGIRALKRGETR